MKTNELKCTDLRIGNWIKYEDKLVQVVQLSSLMILCQRNENQFLVNCAPKEFQPIELTEKILYKIGFCFGGVSEYGKHYVTSNGNDTLWCKIYEDGSMSLTCNNNANLIQLHKVKYLHQLQNAYYCLIGKELNIEL
jgi:hypothetical protein